MRRALAVAAAAALLAGCSIPAAVAPPAAVAKAPVSQPVKAKPGRFAPSAAWNKLTPERRSDVYQAMIDLVDRNQTCWADVAHSYRGMAKDHGYEDLAVPDRKGWHFVMGPYQPGVCG